jgi:divalent metal cation (Fe/Co/Zn/Cd) transporter
MRGTPLRTRQAGRRRFVSLHFLVPGGWTVHRGHQSLEAIERDIRGALCFKVGWNGTCDEARTRSL